MKRVLFTVLIMIILSACTTEEVIPTATPEPVIDEIEMSLGETGRVLVRPSGTEPILRIMVEAPTQEKVESLAQQLVEITEKILSESS